MESDRAQALSEGRPPAARVEAHDARWLAIFEDRHGAGAFDRLMEQLRQPCVTFAGIAKQFGVSRERVRQWHVKLLPDAPRGHQRQQLCALYKQKRRLLNDVLFRSFYNHARPHFDAGRIALIKAEEGYRKRSVRIDERIVAIRDASASATLLRTSATPVYALQRYQGSADFIYLRLTDDDYLFLPRSELSVEGTTFSDRPTSRYRRFKNTFAALQAEGGPRR